MNLKPFNKNQREVIEKGIESTIELTRLVELSLGVGKQKTNYPVIVIGPPGIGKTHTAKHVAEKHNIRLRKIPGNITKHALSVTLATAAFLSDNQTLYFWFDDCNSLLNDSKVMQALRGMLDKLEQSFTYNVDLSSTLARYRNSPIEEHQLFFNALSHYRHGAGVRIPTDNMRFIITSNHPLPSERERKNNQLDINRAAIRSRARYYNFELTGEDKWGWVASVLLSNDMYELTEKQKVIILKWMFDKWSCLPGDDLRIVEMLAEDMKFYPTNYEYYWEKLLDKLSKS